MTVEAQHASPASGWLDSDLMEWSTPQYSRSQVDRAGETYIRNGVDATDRALALTVINNWRSSHSNPLNTFQIGLRRIAGKFDPDALIAQRIKRLPSIRLKLVNIHGMALSRMHDIGGCRAIMRDVDAVNMTVEYYLKHSRIEGKFAKEYPYIECPAKTGYRGVHLVYRHRNRRNPAWDNLKIEIQLRTQLQHAWATSVETVGLFEAQSLKSNMGDDKTLRFFALMGTAIAVREGTARVPGTPDNDRDLTKELRSLANSTKIVSRLETIGALLRSPIMEQSSAKFFILDLNIPATNLTVHRYVRRLRAELEYTAFEQASSDDPDRDVVLVSVDSVMSLKRAFPNYFLDTAAFVGIVQAALAG